MHHAFPFLPLEVQTSIKEIAALGTIPDAAIDLLIERTSKALEAKTVSAQRAVIEIEEQSTARVDLISNRLEDRLRIMLGETNGMLVEVRTSVQTQGAAVEGLRAEFHNGLSAIGERVTDNTMRIEVLERKVAEHDGSRDRSIEERRLLRQDMDESKAHRAQLQAGQEAIVRELGKIKQDLQQLLAMAGDNHEPGD